MHIFMTVSVNSSIFIPCLTKWAGFSGRQEGMRWGARADELWSYDAFVSKFSIMCCQKRLKTKWTCHLPNVLRHSKECSRYDGSLEPKPAVFICWVPVVSSIFQFAPRFFMTVITVTKRSRSRSAAGASKKNAGAPLSTPTRRRRVHAAPQACQKRKKSADAPKPQQLV